MNAPHRPWITPLLRLGLGILLLTLNGRQAVAQEPPLGFTSQLATEDAVVDLRVNGFPLARIPDEGNLGSKSILASAFLKQGANLIELRVFPMSDPDGKTLPRHAVIFDLMESATLGEAVTRALQVARFTDLEQEQPGKRTEFRKGDVIEAILRSRAGGDPGVLEWENETGAVEARTEGDTEVIRLNLPLPRAALAGLPWLNPQPVMNAAAQTAIRAKVAALHAALAAKDWPAVEGLLDAKLDRQAEAFAIPRAEVFIGTMETLDEIFFSDGFTLAPLAPENLEITPVDDLNLFKVTLNELPPISGEGNEYEYTMPVYFSLIADSWEIVE